MWDDNCIEFLSLSLQMVKMQSQSWGSFLEEKGIFFCASLNLLSCFSKRLWWGFWCKMFLVLVSGFGLPQRLYLSILFLKSWIEMSYKTLIWNYINPIFPLLMLLLVISTDVFSIGTCNYGPLGLAALSWMCQGFLFFNFFFFPANSIEHLQLSLTLFGTLDASNCVQGIQREAFQTNSDSWKTLACVKGGKDFFLLAF